MRRDVRLPMDPSIESFGEQACTRQTANARPRRRFLNAAKTLPCLLTRWRRGHRRTAALAFAALPRQGLPMFTRRQLLASTLAWPALPTLAADDEVTRLLREGGALIAFRHALAPGTFDPPGFKPGVCSTQRNLSDEGRAQARRIGEWFSTRGLKPARVRSSPWCRCLDTATLAFGQTESWAALGSPRGATESTNAESLAELRRALAAASVPGRPFEVWVTHMFVLSDLAGTGSSSGEGLVLRLEGTSAVKVLARLQVS
jgi:phosphohistidine phosphatase SixA